MYTTQKSSTFVVSSGIRSPFVFFVKDKPSSHASQDMLTEYLLDASHVFHKECEKLLALDHVFTRDDAHRLSMMLNLLTDARKTWQEEKDEVAV